MEKATNISFLINTTCRCGLQHNGDVIEGNKQEGGGVAPMALFDYPLLPRPPSKKIKDILSKMLIWQGWYKQIIAWADFLHFVLIIVWEQMLNHA